MVPKSYSPDIENIILKFPSGTDNRTFLSYQVCVIVPVRNEGGHLYQTLEALRKQTDVNGQQLPPDAYEVLVLVNNSTDESFQIAAKYAHYFPEFSLSVGSILLPEDQAHIGTVRRLLMDEAYNRLTQAGNVNGIIASTDGDTVVDSQWVFHIMAEIKKGNDAVGGRILTQKEKGNARLYHLRDVAYRCLLAQAECLIDPLIHNPYPCHFQYFGANMAVTCKMYEQAGKLPVIPFLEDVAFHKALMSVDARVRNSVHVKVHTSTRTDGRVQVGFSEQLKKWQQEEKTHQTQMVEDVTALLRRFSLKNLLRKCWSGYQESRIVDQDELDHIASVLQLKSDWLEAAMTESVYFGSFWNLIECSASGDLGGDAALQPIDEAIKQLRQFIKKPDITAFQKSPAGKSLLAHYAKV